MPSGKSQHGDLCVISDYFGVCVCQRPNTICSSSSDDDSDNGDDWFKIDPDFFPPSKVEIRHKLRVRP